MLKDRIQEIKEYFVGMEVTNGISILRVRFPNKWGVYPNKENTIQVTKDEEKNSNIYFYYANYEEVSFDEMFNLVQETIKMNVNAQKKIELLHQKFEELKVLFANNDYENLINLKFEFTAPKTKRKTNRKGRNKASDDAKVENGTSVQVQEEKALETVKTDENKVEE